jgi:uncharacterized membrane protein
MDDGTRAAVEPRTVDGGRGITWWSESWTLFMKNPGLWIAYGVILFVVFLVLGFIPLVGGLVSTLIAPVFIGGWMLAARKVDNGGTLELADLFEGFKARLQPLVVVGALLLAAAIVIGLLVGGLGFGSAMGVMSAGHGGAGMAAAMGAGMLAMLVLFVLGFVVAMAFWYAPALVVFRDTPPVDALKASFAASLRNVIAFLLYGVIYVVAAIIASIPFGLGWIVLIPLVMLSIYVSYKDVYA